jgi:serine/threonine protein phosphatase PrpC
MANSDFTLHCFGLSDIGLVRSNNEDIWSDLSKHGFFILADGMGGHNAGEVAAKEAVRFICTSMEELFSSPKSKWSLQELSSFIKLSIENANSWVYHLGQKKKEYKGMGTTLCSLLFYKRDLIYSHVGDSRIYRYRKRQFDQLTKDHSLKNALISQGKFKEASPGTFPYKNVLTRAIGTHAEIDAEIDIAHVNTDDIYLMCTDGLSDYVESKEIASTLRKHTNPKIAATHLIAQAKENGGNDNITVVIITAKENS